MKNVASLLGPISGKWFAPPHPPTAVRRLPEGVAGCRAECLDVFSHFTCKNTSKMGVSMVSRWCLVVSRGVSSGVSMMVSQWMDTANELIDAAPRPHAAH